MSSTSTFGAKRCALSALVSALAIVLCATNSYLTVEGGCDSTSSATLPMNNNTIYDEEPVFVKGVPNGEMYTVGNDENRIHLLHVYGSSGYDFGYAAGQLLGDMAKKNIEGMWDHFREDVYEELRNNPKYHGLSNKSLEELAEGDMETVLGKQNEMDEPYIDPQYYAELKGMADATGLNYTKLLGMHLIGEVTHLHCSLYGAYGNATKDGKVLQLRSLDWDMHAGLQNYPTVTVYHPMNKSLGYPFANVGWAGWIATVTGMSSNRIGISEIGVDYPGPDPNKTYGTTSPIGIPFVFLERQIVQYGTSVYDAMDMIQNATRTTRLVLGVADGKAQTARMVAYSHSKIRIFDAEDLHPVQPWHPRLPDTVYCGMDWYCPWYQRMLHQQLQLYHGRLTPELSIQNVTAAVGTGDLHAAVYDLTDNLMFVANARGVNQTGPDPAYARQFIRLNMTSLFMKTYGHNQTL